MSVPHGVQTASEGKPPRRFSRQRIETLVYADLGPDNGGFPINISEDGMAFQGVRPLSKNENIKITFKLPGTDKSVTGTAEIVWLNESGKGGGLQFIGLPEDSRRIVDQWLSLHRPTGGPNEKTAVTTSLAESNESQSSSTIPPVADQADISPPGIVTAEPPPSPSVSTREASQEIAATVMPAVAPMIAIVPEPSVAEDDPGPESAELTISTQPFRIRILLPNDKKKASWIMLFGAWLVILLALTVAGGLLLIRVRTTLSPAIVNNNTARPNIQTSTIPAPPPEQSATVEPATAPVTESSEAAPITAESENQKTLPSDVTKKDASRATENTSPRVPPIAHEAPSIVFAKQEDIRPPDQVILPASREQSATVTRNATPDRLQERAAEPGDEHETPIRSAIEQKSASATPKSQDASRSLDNTTSAPGSVEIIPDSYPSIRVPPEWKEWVSRPGVSFHVGHIVTSAKPIYPKDALQRGVAGTVKLHVIIGRDGAVEGTEVMEGPGLLVEAAVRAVQEWRYEPTLIGGAAIEAEENITIVFRLAGPVTSAN